MTCNSTLSFLFSFLITLSLAAPALAARYDCSTTQAFEWKDGTLREITNDSRSVMSLKDVVRFDDKTGALWAGTNPTAPTTLHVAQPLRPDSDLVASLETSGSRYTGTLLLRIRTVNGGLTFLFISDDAFESGRCTVMDGN